MEKSIKYPHKLIFYICIFIYLIFGLSAVYLADLRVTDENWHFAASSLVAQGKVPYRDFAYFRMPVVPYFYGLAIYLFGTNLMVGRLTSLLLGLLTVIFIYKAAKRLKGEYAGIFAILIVIFNMAIMRNLLFYWMPLASFFLAAFCLLLVSNVRLKYSLCTALLVLTQGTRYGLDYMTAYTLLFVLFAIWLNRKDKGVIAGVIISYIGMTLLIYSPLFFAPQEFLFGTITHYFYDNFMLAGGRTIDAGYTSLICFYDRIKMLMILFSGYYIFILFSVFTYFLKKDIVQRRVYLVFGTLVALNTIFYLGLFGHHLTKFVYHCFPVLAILIGCSIGEILEHFGSHKEKLFLTIFLLSAIIFNFFTQDIEDVISSPQYAGVKFVNQVSCAIKRYTKPEDRVFAFINGYVLHAGRQIFTDTIFDISAGSLFPKLSDQEAGRYKLLSPNILLSYFKDKKAKVVVLERPGRLEHLEESYRKKIETALSENYVIVEKIYKYPGNIPEEAVYIYKAK